ncbi:hypothetical protein [Hydrogenophaga sp.]|uniref:hypothetical protein n=1 Tax=Hydrogenophaga sp. TaxID=1904254 RepID=UPI002717027C|nr:hypothetical protein [Hydrogenophaga sp.]MDO8903980.1 hypothetical protein [Hydrogenophaga sp.]
MAKVQLMGLREYARHRGCAVSAVAKAISEERISVILDEKGRKCIDPDVADIQWAKNTRARADSVRPAASSAAGEGDGGGASPETPTAPEIGADAASKAAYTDYRAQTEQETLRQKRRENMAAEGKLADVVQLRRAVFDGFRLLRDRAMAVPQRAAPRCIGLSDARDIERVIDEEQRRAFADWEQTMHEKLPQPQEDQQ